jgi:hypothetical protein
MIKVGEEPDDDDDGKKEFEIDNNTEGYNFDKIANELPNNIR